MAEGLEGVYQRIRRMNAVMKVSCPPEGELRDLGPERIQRYLKIIRDEVSEMDDVVLEKALSREQWVDLADWLADNIVYHISEAVRWGIPIIDVLNAVMDSQDSKLDENGQPIIDQSTGKFLKGPNYVPPEATIEKILFTDRPNQSASTKSFPGERYLGLVIPYSKCPSGYARIVAFDHQGQDRVDIHSKPWRYKLVECDIGGVDTRNYQGFVVYHEAGIELDQAIKMILGDA